MAVGKFIAYYRVSTKKQGKSGLGLDAQKEAVANYLNGGKWKLVAEKTEIETGKLNSRPALAEALLLCRLHNATLIIAKLDRLARNARFLLTIVEESGESGVVFCDLPTVPPGPVGKFLITQMAATAELEAGLVSQRTKSALSAAKARGTKLGGLRGPAGRMKRISKLGTVQSAKVRSEASERRRSDLQPILEDIQKSGAKSLREIAAALNERGVTTPRGGEWSAVQVKRLLDATDV